MVSHFDAFMRHYLTLHTDEIPRIGDVYEAFKSYARLPKVAEKGVDALVADINRFASYYCAMALGQEEDRALAAAFRDLRELKVDVAWPFLLELYNDYSQGLLMKEDLLNAVRLVESYIFRRAVCAIPTNSLNKTFATFRRALDKSHYLESNEAHFLLLPSYRRFPRDEEFERELKRRDLYNFRSRSYWLRRLENHGRKEPVPVDEYTIEHILPQNENLSSEWQKALGPNCKKIQETWLHTLGNLTLTGYNSEYSDRPFLEKRNMQGGFMKVRCASTRGLGEVEVWSETAIQSRAERNGPCAPGIRETDWQWGRRVIIDQLKLYPTYKDTRVEWLGEVATHWEMRRLKQIARLNPSKSEVPLTIRNDPAVFLPMERVGLDGRFDTSEVRPFRICGTGYLTHLISDVVTGKVDVREVAERLLEEPPEEESAEQEPMDETEVSK